MPNDVTQSLVVEFTGAPGSGGGSSGSSGGSLRLEYDTRPQSEGGLNVRSRPLLTDTAHLLLFAFRAANIVVTSSAGNASLDPTPQTATFTESVSFSEDDTARLNRAATSISSVTWQGADGGAVSLNGQEVTISAPGTFLAQITYEV